MVADVEQRRDAYMGDQRRLADRLIAGGNLERMRSHYQSLPPAVRNGAIGSDLTDAINQAERERNQAHQEIVSDAREQLLDWRFDAFEGHILRYRSRVEGGPAAAELDALSQTLNDLDAMFSAMNQALNAQANKPRYRGIIGGLRDPDLLSVNREGVTLDPSGGEGILIYWRTISADDRRALLDLALGQAAAAHYPALQTMAGE